MFLDLISKKEDKVKEFNTGDKIGYALGDFGCAIFFGFVSSYLMVFYTDVLGIGAAAVGTLFIVARIWDAINDPMMGMILDRSKASKYGRFRPYLVKFGLVMVLAGILAFTAIPALPENLKLPYAYVTYIIFGMSYTAVNIPYGSLSSVMTNDPDQRTSLSTFRNLGSMLASVATMLVVPKFVFNAEGAVTAEGFVKCAMILAVISSVAFFLSFRLTRERIVHQTTGKKQNAGKTLGTILSNRAFLGIAISSFFSLGGMLTMSSLNVYLFKDYFNAPHLTALGGMLGMASSILVMPLVGPIAKRIGKKETAVIGGLFATSIYAIMLFIPNLTVQMFLGLAVVAGLGGGLSSTVTWALVADAIDYQEYKTGERNEGTVYSTYSLARKLGQVISGGMGGFALSMVGYQSGVAMQAAGVGIGIKNIAFGMAALGYGLSALTLLFVFNLSKKKVVEMNDELSQRRAAKVQEEELVA